MRHLAIAVLATVIAASAVQAAPAVDTSAMTTDTIDNKSKRKVVHSGCNR